MAFDAANDGWPILSVRMSQGTPREFKSWNNSFEKARDCQRCRIKVEREVGNCCKGGATRRRLTRGKKKLCVLKGPSAHPWLSGGAIVDTRVCRSKRSHISIKQLKLLCTLHAHIFTSVYMQHIFLLKRYLTEQEFLFEVLSRSEYS